MGSSTGIGFVYGVGDNAIFQFVKIMELLLLNNGTIDHLKYCKDINGDEWVEKKVTVQALNKNTLYPLINNYYGQVSVKCDLLSKKDLNIDVYFKKIDSKNLGILLYIPDEQIFGSDVGENINLITENVINLIQQIYNISNFDYAFCDNEATVEYSLDDLKAIENPIYSILALPNEENKTELQILKSDWNIDGLTPRTG